MDARKYSDKNTISQGVIKIEKLYLNKSSTMIKSHHAKYKTAINLRFV